MAKLKKNGNLSGAIGNIVFVNSNDRTFVRAKAGRVKQTPKTKAAAGIFGLVSTREKYLRMELWNILDIPPIQYFAAKHRARIQKTIVENPLNDTKSNPEFGNPQGLAGFSFNPKLEWQSCTNFFPAIERTSTDEIKVSLPEINWKKQITPPKNCNSAVVTLHAVSADFNSEYVPVKVLSKIEMEISATASFPAQEWLIPTDSAEGWLLLVGCVKFFTRNQPSAAIEEFSAAYLWAEQVEG